MKNNVFKILVVLLISFVFINVNAATSLKDLKNSLAKCIAEKNTILKKEAEIKAKMQQISSEIKALIDKIEDNNRKIEESRKKIIELEAEIKEKQVEIDKLISFKQTTKGNKLYLEYIFEAKTFTDFIYRSAIVEQLSKYNDQLIDEMNALIEENKRLQAQLQEEINKSEGDVKTLNNKIRSLGLDVQNLSEERIDVEADIQSKQREVDYLIGEYARNGCSDEMSINECIKMPYATGLTRPLQFGYISSNYGWRLHPTMGYYRMHNGIDIGLPERNKVYASATGKVSRIVHRSSCGGNQVYIRHLVNGKEYTTVYMHLLDYYVKVGDIVTLYDVVGIVGGASTWWDSCTTGAHLHFGVMVGWNNTYYVDPRNYINFPPKGSSFYSRF